MVSKAEGNEGPRSLSHGHRSCLGVGAAVAVAVEAKDFDVLGSDAPRGKQRAAISVCSFAGATRTVTAIGAIRAAKGSSQFRPGPTARAGVPLSLVKGPSVGAQAVQRFVSFGSEFGLKRPSGPGSRLSVEVVTVN